MSTAVGAASERQERVEHSVLAPKRVPGWRRWWRGLGIPKFDDQDNGSYWTAKVLMDGALIALHPIEPDSEGYLGQIETGVHLDRRTLAAALLRGSLRIVVRHDVWNAKLTAGDRV